MKTSLLYLHAFLLINITSAYAQTDAKIYYARAMELVHNHDYKSAIAELDLALQADPAYTTAYAERARLRILLGEYAQASQDYHKALELSTEYNGSMLAKSPVNDLLEEYKGFIYAHKSDILYTYSSDHPHSSLPDTLNHNSKAYFHYVHGRFNQSEKYIRKALAEDETNSYCYYLLGAIREAQGDYQQALFYYSQNVNSDSLFYFHYYKRALVLKKIGKYEDALQDLNKAEQLHQSCEFIYYNRAVIYKKNNKLTEALNDLNKAIQIRSSFAEAYFNRSFVKKQLADYKGALDDLDVFISYHPNDAMAYNNRANIKMLSGDAEGAQADYDKAVTIDDRLGIAFFNRGVSNMMLGNRDEACLDFNTGAILGNSKAKKRYLLHCY